jgi:hypothetical protein
MVFMVSSKYFPADYLLNSKEPLTFVFAFSEKDAAHAALLREPSAG